MTTPSASTSRPARRRLRTARRLLVSGALVLVVLVASGCAKGPSMPTSAELNARPSIAEVMRTYDQMQERVRAAVDTAMGPQKWSRLENPGGTSGCGGDVGVDGDAVTMPTWLFEGSIDDAQWPAVKTAVLGVIAQYDFQQGGMAVDTGPRHTLNAYETPFGAIFNFGNDVNTLMQVITGCHPRTKA